MSVPKCVYVVCFILQIDWCMHVVTMATGAGLMEIVTEPDMTCGVEAASFVRELQLVLQTIHSCDGNIQDGSLRVDANVSVSPEGSTSLGTRAEVKNVSGLRFLSRAIGELWTTDFQQTWEVEGE